MFPLALQVQLLLTGTCVFLRIGGIFSMLPFFGDRSVPVQIRALLCVALAIFFVPLIKDDYGLVQDLETFSLGFLMLKELFIGIAIGFLARIMFEGLVFAASIVSYQMGFGMSNLIMPGSDDQLNAFTAFHRLLVILFFFALNFHNAYVMAVYNSFLQIPLGGFTLSSDYLGLVSTKSAELFTIGVQFSAPVLVALMFAMAALGLIAKTVPQMNVFTMSFPLSFFIGLMTYVATIPFFPGWLRKFYENQSQGLVQAIQFIGN